MIQPSASSSPASDIDFAAYELPPLGDNPSTTAAGTTPGSFANKGRVGTAYTYSSPDTPGMPAPSDKTAWDFLPDDWSITVDADGVKRAIAPKGFVPITQLEHARLGNITPPNEARGGT